MVALSKEEVQLIIVTSAAVHALFHQRGAHKVCLCMGGGKRTQLDFSNFNASSKEKQG